MKNIKIYTDGACDFNTRGAHNIGGYAFAIVDEENKLISDGYGRMKNTTNNRMEIKAVIEAIKKVEDDWNVTIYSDSKYVVNTIMSGWKKRKNIDLWEELCPMVKQNIRLEWLKGHNGDKFNEYCDTLATKRIKLTDIPQDLAV
jgi:ribonuclease HI